MVENVKTCGRNRNGQSTSVVSPAYAQDTIRSHVAEHGRGNIVANRDNVLRPTNLLAVYINYNNS